MPGRSEPEPISTPDQRAAAIAKAQAQRQFWERSALAALLVVLEDTDVSSGEAAGLAIGCADQMVVAWRDRFDK